MPVRTLILGRGSILLHVLKWRAMVLKWAYHGTQVGVRGRITALKLAYDGIEVVYGGTRPTRLPPYLQQVLSLSATRTQVDTRVGLTLGIGYCFWYGVEH
eukprot:2221606-Rhodomonas_salina.1